MALKMERQRLKEEEEVLRQAQNRAVKDQLKSNIEHNKKHIEDKVRRDVDYVKQEKREQKDYLHIQK